MTKHLARAAIVAAMLATSMPAHAGGNAASPWPLQDIFDTPPPAATARKGSACEAQAKYVGLMDAHRQADVGALFAEDAVMLDWDGVVHHGKADISRWYAGAQGPIRVTPLSFIDAGRDCFTEVATLLGTGPDAKFGLSAMNHVTVNDKGEIVRAVYYLRPYIIRRMPPPPGK